MLTNYSPLYVTQANPALRSPPQPYIPVETVRAHSSPSVRSAGTQYRSCPPPVQSQILHSQPSIVRRPSTLRGSRAMPTHGLGFQSRTGPIALNPLLRTESPAARAIDPYYKQHSHLPPLLATRQSPNMSIRRTQPASSRRDSGAYATDVRTIDDTCSSVMTATAGYVDLGEPEGVVPTQSDFSFGGRIEVGVRTERSHDVSISVASQRGRLRCRSGLIRQRTVREASSIPATRGLRRFQCTTRARKLPTLRNIDTTTKDTKACAIRIEQKLGELQAHLVGQAARQKSPSHEAAATSCHAERVVSDSADTQAAASTTIDNIISPTRGYKEGVSNPQQFSLVSSACGDETSTSLRGRSYSSDTLYDNVGGEPTQRRRQYEALQELNALSEAAAELQRCVTRVQNAILYGKDLSIPRGGASLSSRHVATSESEGPRTDSIADAEEPATPMDAKQSGGLVATKETSLAAAV